ncbi:MAG TPA: hypothetical protein VKC34_03435, partial [Blastocatellia bacterium]|nr:hypothetical protein [Blastocatellia bacterium]
KSRGMMVREHMREDEWRLTIVFDTTRPGRPMSPPGPAGDSSREESDGFEEKFESAIIMAASLANHFMLERAEVELITPTEEHNVRSGTGHDHLYKILRSLATLQPAAARELPGNPASEQGTGGGGRPRRRGLFRGKPRPSGNEQEGLKVGRAGSGWRLLDEVPVLADERRFKVLITSAAKGTIPANVWRSSHVVFIDDM